MNGTDRSTPLAWFPQHYDDVEAWAGATEDLPAEGPQWWGHRSCGIACLRTILEAHGIAAPSAHRLLARGLAIGAYTPLGWLHQGLADLAAEHGLRAAAVGHEGPEVLRARAAHGLPSIVSVTHLFPEDGRKGGHLVVFGGEDGPIADRRAHFMCPSRWGETTRSLPAERFWASWTGRAIVFEPAGGARA